MSLEQGSHQEQYMSRQSVEYTGVDYEHVCVVHVCRQGVRTPGS